MKRSSATLKEGDPEAGSTKRRRPAKADDSTGDGKETTLERKSVSRSTKSDKIPYQDLLKGKNRHRLPDKIMRCLMQGIEPEVLWWSPHETGFTVDSETVQGKLLDVHFRGTKLSSLVRSLNRWGFRRDFYRTLPKHALAFQHPEFRKGAPHLLKDMKIIPSISQEIPDDSSESDQEAKSAVTEKVDRTLKPKDSGSASFSQRVTRQGFPLPVNPMAQSLLLSQNQTPRLPNSLLQQDRQIRHPTASGQSLPYDSVISQLQQPANLRMSQVVEANPFLVQSSLPAGSNPMLGSGQQSSNIGSTLMPPAFSGFSADFSSASMLRAAQLQQQQQQEGLSSYLQALRHADGVGNQSLLLGQQNQVSQLSLIQARLRGASSADDETLRVSRISDLNRQADPAGRLQVFPQRHHQASPFLPQPSEQQSSLSPHEQLLLNTTLEREQVNAQIQALRHQMRRRQGMPSRGGNPAAEGSQDGKGSN